MAETESLEASDPGDPVTVKTTTGKITTEVHTNGETVSDVTVAGLDETLGMQVSSEAEKEKITNGQTETLCLEITDITAAIPATDHKLAVSAIQEVSTDAVLCLALDLSLSKQMEGESAIVLTSIGSNTLEITVRIPETAQNSDSSVNRKFYVVRVHSGKAEVLNPDVNGDRLKFQTGLFSTYEIFYVDQSTDLTSSVDETVQSSTTNSGSGSGGSSNGSNAPTAASVTVTGTTGGSKTGSSSGGGSAQSGKDGENAASSKDGNEATSSDSSGARDVTEDPDRSGTDSDEKQISKALHEGNTETDPDYVNLNDTDVNAHISPLVWKIPILLLIGLVILLFRKLRNRKGDVEWRA